MIKMQLKPYIGLLALAMGLTACSNDDEAPAMRPTLPATTGSIVTAIRPQGTIDQAYEWNFTYIDNRLTSATGKLHTSSQPDYSYTSQLTYSAQGVAFTTSQGSSYTLTLNPQGYIQQMMEGRNEYNFAYDATGHLISWNKTAYEQSVAGANTYTSSAMLTYGVGGVLRGITYTNTDHRRHVLNIENTDYDNINGLLPATLSKEMGCLGFEQLYYAGLLGKAPAALVKKLTYTYPDDATATEAKETTFEYGFDSKGNVTLCNYHAADGTISNVVYTYQQ